MLIFLGQQTDLTPSVWMTWKALAGFEDISVVDCLINEELLLACLKRTYH